MGQSESSEQQPSAWREHLDVMLERQGGDPLPIIRIPSPRGVVIGASHQKHVRFDLVTVDTAVHRVHPVVGLCGYDGPNIMCNYDDDSSAVLEGIFTPDDTEAAWARHRGRLHVEMEEQQAPGAIAHPRGDTSGSFHGGGELNISLRSGVALSHLFESEAASDGNDDHGVNAEAELISEVSQVGSDPLDHDDCLSQVERLYLTRCRLARRGHGAAGDARRDPSLPPTHMAPTVDGEYLERAVRHSRYQAAEDAADAMIDDPFQSAFAGAEPQFYDFRDEDDEGEIITESRPQPAMAEQSHPPPPTATAGPDVAQGSADDDASQRTLHASLLEAARLECVLPLVVRYAALTLLAQHLESSSVCRAYLQALADSDSESTRGEVMDLLISLHGFVRLHALPFIGSSRVRRSGAWDDAMRVLACISRYIRSRALSSLMPVICADLLTFAPSCEPGSMEPPSLTCAVRGSPRACASLLVCLCSTASVHGDRSTAKHLLLAVIALIAETRASATPHAHLASTEIDFNIGYPARDTFADDVDGILMEAGIGVSGGAADGGIGVEWTGIAQEARKYDKHDSVNACDHMLLIGAAFLIALVRRDSDGAVAELAESRCPDAVPYAMEFASRIHHGSVVDHHVHNSQSAAPGPRRWHHWAHRLLRGAPAIAYWLRLPHFVPDHCDTCISLGAQRTRSGYAGAFSHTTCDGALRAQQHAVGSS